MLFTDKKQFTEALRLLVVAGAGVLVFGLVERFVLGTGFWERNVDALGFYGKTAQSGLLPPVWIRPFQGVPEGIFVAFPVDVPVRRMVSTFLEPTTLGAFLALVFLVVMFVPSLYAHRLRYLVAALAIALSVGIAATVSRGGMQIALTGGALMLALTWKRTFVRPWLRLENAALAVSALVLLSSLLVTSASFSQLPNRRDQLQDILGSRIVSGLEPVPPAPVIAGPLNQGAVAHINGLNSGLEQMVRDPLGLGLGAAGAWSEAPEVGSESTVGTLAAQLGVIGFALWLAFYTTVVASLVQAGLKLRQAGQTVWSEVNLVLGAALLGLFISAWFSESASGLLGNAFFFLFAGWALAVSTPQVQGVRFRRLPFQKGKS